MESVDSLARVISDAPGDTKPKESNETNQKRGTAQKTGESNQGKSGHAFRLPLSVLLPSSPRGSPRCKPPTAQQQSGRPLSPLHPKDEKIEEKQGRTENSTVDPSSAFDASYLLKSKDSHKPVVADRFQEGEKAKQRRARSLHAQRTHLLEMLRTLVQGLFIEPPEICSEESCIDGLENEEANTLKLEQLLATISLGSRPSMPVIREGLLLIVTVLLQSQKEDAKNLSATTEYHDGANEDDEGGDSELETTVDDTDEADDSDGTDDYNDEEEEDIHAASGKPAYVSSKVIDNTSDNDAESDDYAEGEEEEHSLLSLSQKNDHTNAGNKYAMMNHAVSSRVPMLEALWPGSRSPQPVSIASRYEFEPIKSNHMVSLRYPRQPSGATTELPRVVPHLARQINEHDNLQRAISFRHILHHQATKLRLETFLKESGKVNNVEEELHWMLTMTNEEDQEKQPTQIPHQPAEASQHSAAARSAQSERSYLKNYLAQKALREKRDKERKSSGPSNSIDAGCENLLADMDAEPMSTAISEDACLSDSTDILSAVQDSDQGLTQTAAFPMITAGEPEDTFPTEDISVADLVTSDDLNTSKASYLNPMLMADSFSPAQEEQYNCLIKHLIVSERKFISNLDSSAAILTSIVTEDTSLYDAQSPFVKVLSQLEILSAINKEFLIRIERCKLGTKSVGYCFCDMLPYFEMYKAYAHTVQKVVQHFGHILQKAVKGQIAEDPQCFIKQLEEPLRRIFDYASITRALAGCMAEGHCHPNLLQAADKMREMAENVGLVRLSSKNQMALPFVSFPGHKDMEIAGRGRQLIRSGSFTKLSGRGELIARRLFLFSDVCLICYELRSRLCLLRTFIPMEQALILDNGEISNSFSLLRSDTNEGGVFNASSREEKEKWLDELNRVYLSCLPVTAFVL